MQLPPQKLPQIPRSLFPLETLESCERTITPAAARNVLGDFYEEATASLLGAIRLRTSSNHKVCPDLQYRQGKRIFFESKSVGKTRHVIIYQNRWEKDQRWINRHRARHYYCIWTHRLSVPGTDITISRLHATLPDHTHCLYLIPTVVLKELITQLPLRVLNTAYIQSGPNTGKRLGYGSKSSCNGIGWSIPISQIEQHCHRTIYSFPTSVYGYTIQQPIVRTSLPPSQLTEKMEFVR